MWKFGNTSNARLDTCHEDIQKLVKLSLETSPMDIAVVCGSRSEVAQMAAYNAGNSKAKYGQSPHNNEPSLAVDLAPYVRGVGIPWDDSEKFLKLGEHVKKCADDLGISIRWGGDFKSFLDMPHFELKEWRKIKDK